MIALAEPRQPDTELEKKFFALFQQKENLSTLQREYVELLEEILRTNACFSDEQTYFLLITYRSITYPFVWEHLNDEALDEFRKGCQEFQLLP